MTRHRHPLLLIALAALLVVLAISRPLDHDESQYVAATVLTAGGLLPYRDFAYLQSPLQPFVFAPAVWLVPDWPWVALRLVNALIGVGTVALVYAAARRARAASGAALAATALFLTCDVFLFSVGTARNDALPCLLLAAALLPIVRASEGGASRGSALLAGLLLAAAAAAKISYALPAAAYGLFALIDRRHRPGWVALGALPVVAFTGWLWWTAPEAFWFGLVDFPARAPAEYYGGGNRAWKLGWGIKFLDFLKYLALGPALMAFALATRFRWRREARVLDWMLIAAVLAALLPTPTWRQYLLPILPLLFVRLAVGWTLRPPTARGRVWAVIFACAGLSPTIAALIERSPGLPASIDETRDMARVLDAAGVGDGVVTLAPEFLGRRRVDVRFATGPFYFRSATLLPADAERRLHLVSHARLDGLGRPPAILTGAEGWTSGRSEVDDVLDRWAIAHGYVRRDPPSGRLVLWLRPR